MKGENCIEVLQYIKAQVGLPFAGQDVEGYLQYLLEFFDLYPVLSFEEIEEIRKAIRVLHSDGDRDKREN